MRIGTIVVIALMVTGCGSSGGGSPTGGSTPTATLTPSVAPPPPKPTKLTVTPILFIKLGSASFPNYRVVGKHCKGAGGYADLHVKASVTVYNASGHKVVGTGFIRKSLSESGKCGLIGKVSGLPVLPFYQVQFANRNKIAFSASDLIHHKSFETIG